MPFKTVALGAALTPTVISTCFSHYLHRKSLHNKPTVHLAYDESLHVLREFLAFAAKNPVEDIQEFCRQRVPSPPWTRTEGVDIPDQYLASAATVIIESLGPKGIDAVGGKDWWQWRGPAGNLQGEWIEVRGEYNQRKKVGEAHYAGQNRVVLYMHGGAYFFGSVETHRYQIQRHARKLQARMFTRSRYRLAPQYPFPCPLLDCLASYLWLLSQYEPKEIIFAGDSAGGGMALSLLVMIRDKGLPMPAGAILLSPWVDLTHSFPSIVQDNPGDYIPPIGFRCKPSAAWPPPNSDQIRVARKEALENSEANDGAEKAIPKKDTEAETTAKKGYSVHPDGLKYDEQSNPRQPESRKDPERREANTVFVGLDGERVEVKDQIHMYTTNNLLSHPLVSPALQPSLGGLPPLQIVTGGGEMLRDEQIYVAHKAANPTAYPPSDAYLDEYDPTGEILNKYPPTYVQLQVWDDLCHVAPALSFTRPAKYMFRSIAQFGSWALPRNQNDTNISEQQDPAMTPGELAIRQLSTNGTDNTSGPQQSVGSVGRAGDPLPAFQDHMIRQRVDKRGRIYPLDPPHTFAALQMSPSQVGTFNPALVKKWLAGKQEWDEKFAKEKLHFQSRRIKELYHEFQNADGESPPPSALAARKAAPGILPPPDEKKNYLMLMWNHWATKHDKKIIGREQHDEQAIGRRERTSIDSGTTPPIETPVNEGLQPDTTQRSNPKPQTGNGPAFNGPKGIQIDAGTANQEIAESRAKKSTGDLSTTSDLLSNYQPASPRTYKSSYDRPMGSPLLVLPDYDDKKHTDENASTKALFHAAGTLPVSVSETSLSRPSRSYRPGSRADSVAGFTEDANSTVADDKSLAVTTVGADNASTRAVLHSTGVVGLINDGASAGLGGSARQSIDALSTSHRAPSDIDVVSSMGVDAENGERISMAKERPHMPERERFQTADEFQ